MEVIENQEAKESFHVLDMKAVRDRIALWKKHLPKVTMHYAVKANDNDKIICEMLRESVNFDCASKNEIAKVL